MSSACHLRHALNWEPHFTWLWILPSSVRLLIFFLFMHVITIYIFLASSWSHHDSVLGNDRIIVCFIDHYKPFCISAWFIAFKILSPFPYIPLPWGQLSGSKAHWLWVIQLTTAKKAKILEMNESLHHFFDDSLLILSSHKESEKCEAVTLVKKWKCRNSEEEEGRNAAEGLFHSGSDFAIKMLS